MSAQPNDAWRPLARPGGVPTLVRVLDGVAVHVGGGPATPVSGRVRTGLLALSALHAPHPVAVSATVERIWGDEPSGHAGDQVRRAARELARLDGVEVQVGGDGAWCRLRVPDGRTDVEAFRAHAAAGRELARAGDDVAAAAELGRAVGLWPGAVARGWPADAPWPELTELREEWWWAAEDLAATLVVLGRPAEAIAVLAGPCAAEPLRESAAAVLVRAQAMAGRVDDATRSYDRTRRGLADAVGLDPGSALESEYGRARSTPSGAPGPAEPATVVAYRDDTGFDAPSAVPRVPIAAGDGTDPRDVPEVVSVAGMVLAVFTGPERHAHALRWALDLVAVPARPRLGVVVQSDDVARPAKDGAGGVAVVGPGLLECRRRLDNAAPGTLLACPSTVTWFRSLLGSSGAVAAHTVGDPALAVVPG